MMAANLTSDSALLQDMRQQQEDARKMRHLMATGATEEVSTKVSVGCSKYEEGATEEVGVGTRESGKRWHLVARSSLSPDAGDPSPLCDLHIIVPCPLHLSRRASSSRGSTRTT